MRLFALLMFVCLTTPVSNADDGASPPEWFRQHLAYLTAGDGTWLADNSSFKSDEEPYDSYQVTYVWGAGKQTASGSMRAYRNGKLTGVIWDYRVFWDPATRRGVIQQWGFGGAYGVGETKQGDEKTLRSEQMFYGPDGSGSRSAHDWIVDGPLKHTTRSFSFENGAWKAGRTYVWKRAAEQKQDG
ncbi:MAG: hypothetical protein OEW35_19645 [Gammaproteobacteria bacterium]|nr:hypothetical protein [Gammaproteobacteria bacterium]MDH4256922.1 hypothetical protein [Gammaproteobacteria bacterium]